MGGRHPLILAADELRESLRGLAFPLPVSHVYNPLEYAWEAHAAYLRAFGQGSKRVLFLGMNPGPWGMAQTGVPFGEVGHVRDWMGLATPVGKPRREHPKRPIQGLECPRSEVSGQRLWGFFRECFPDPQEFFRQHFVANYCPLIWMRETGANLTPDKLSAEALRPVEVACQRHLGQVIEALQPEYLIGVGAYAERQFRRVWEEIGGARAVTIGRILHPSPASPAANRGWAEAARGQLADLGLWPLG